MATKADAPARRKRYHTRRKEKAVREDLVTPKQAPKKQTLSDSAGTPPVERKAVEVPSGSNTFTLSHYNLPP
jgi:hypothetical protein